jgi:uncharacterized protein (DUF1684 family)
MRDTALLLALTLSTATAFAADAPKAAKAASSAYAAQIAQWQKDRAQGLLKEDGWFSLVGLFWLKDGANGIGSDPYNRIQLGKAAPAKLGEIVLEHTAGASPESQVKLSFVPAPNSAATKNVTINRQPATARELAADVSGHPDVIQVGTMSIYIIERADGDHARVGVRVKDSQSPYRTGFHGLKFFPVDPALRIEATWTPYTPAKKLKIPSVIGTVSEMDSPGRADFTLAGKQYSLEPVVEGDDELFFIFRDATAAKETYGAGRFLYTAMPKDGKVILDFNTAQNPPCAYTPYATCPLPPRQNQLPVAIRAGEKSYNKSAVGERASTR